MSTTIEVADSTCTAPLNVLNEVLGMTEEINANRRWFHANPELSFKEERTAAKVGGCFAVLTKFVVYSSSDCIYLCVIHHFSILSTV
jgi:hypothetical protein